MKASRRRARRVLRRRTRVRDREAVREGRRRRKRARWLAEYAFPLVPTSREEASAWGLRVTPRQVPTYYRRAAERVRGMIRLRLPDPEWPRGGRYIGGVRRKGRCSAALATNAASIDGYVIVPMLAAPRRAWWIDAGGKLHHARTDRRLVVERTIWARPDVAARVVELAEFALWSPFVADGGATRRPRAFLSAVLSACLAASVREPERVDALLALARLNRRVAGEELIPALVLAPGIPEQVVALLRELAVMQSVSLLLERFATVDLPLSVRAIASAIQGVMEPIMRGAANAAAVLSRIFEALPQNAIPAVLDLPPPAAFPALGSPTPSSTEESSP